VLPEYNNRKEPPRFISNLIFRGFLIYQAAGIKSNSRRSEATGFVTEQVTQQIT
jgi:hypothetical protein